MSDDLLGRRVCVTGGAGFLGRAVCGVLRERGYTDIFVPRSREFDLTKPDAVAHLFDQVKPQVVIHLAAEVGGIGANRRHPGRFFYANMAMGLNLIEEARRRGVEKFVQVGTVCAYPKYCKAPFREDDLWSGYPEETNAPYGVAKRALSVMLDAYRTEYGFPGIYLIPVNLYGPHDNFDPESSHVIPALIRRFHEAVRSGERKVTVWGTGTASREFLYVDDAAAGIVAAAATYHESKPINLGTGREIALAELAGLIAGECGFEGAIRWDATKPDGQPRRQLDVSRASRLLGWKATVDLEEGIRRSVAWWKSQASKGKRIGSPR